MNLNLDNMVIIGILIVLLKIESCLLFIDTFVFNSIYLRTLKIDKNTKFPND